MHSQSIRDRKVSETKNTAYNSYIHRPSKRVLELKFKSFTRDTRAFDTRGDLLESNVARVIWVATVFSTIRFGG